jgi:hypothetical protein
VSNQLPEFETDDELEAWFEDADIRVDELEPALDVEIGDHVELVLDEPWTIHAGSASAPSGSISTSVPA